jgi:predicted LPLAT superfamily acyltransferase
VDADRQWTGRSRGGGWGTWCVAQMAWLGAVPVHCFVLPLAVFYCATDRRARRAITDYWRRLRPRDSGFARVCRVLLHFYSFARILADRFLDRLTPGGLPQRHLGAAAMRACMHSPRGCILLSAHVGSWELSGRWLTRYPEVTVNIVMLAGEDPRVAEQLHRVMGEHPCHIIDLADPTGAGIAIAGALGRGETCCLLGDRTAGDDRHVEWLPFLGKPAAFATGPFIAAAVTGAWIVPAVCVKEGDGYLMRAYRPIRIPSTSRSGRPAVVRQAMVAWVACLERTVRRHPYQWHNFYDFWA